MYVTGFAGRVSYFGSSSGIVTLNNVIWLIGVSLSEPHTSDKNGTSITFTKRYMEIWINGTSIKSLRLKFGLKTRQLTDASSCGFIMQAILPE